MSRINLIFIPTLLSLAGCGVEGTWVTRSVTPPEAAKHFSLGQTTFNADMSFNATALEGDKIVKSKGTYAYDPWTRQLTLKTNGKELKYSAMIWWGKELRVEKQMPNDNLVSTIMERGVPCPICAKCPMCSGTGDTRARIVPVN